MTQQKEQLLNPNQVQVSVILITILLSFLVFIISILEASSTTDLVTNGSPPYAFRDVLRVMGVISSTLLTAALVLLYASQSVIQKQQRDIQNLEQKPNLIVDDLKPAEDNFELDVANIGKGPAKEIKLRIEPYTDSENIEFESSTNEIAKDNKDLNIHTKTENFLMPGDQQKFLGTGTFNGRTSSEGGFSPWAFQVAADELSSNGHHKIEFSVHLEYTGSDEMEYSDEIVEFVLPIKGYTELPLAFEHGTTRYRLENDPHPPDIKRSHANMEKDSARGPPLE